MRRESGRAHGDIVLGAEVPRGCEACEATAYDDDIQWAYIYGH